MKESINKGIYRDNIKLHLKVLLTLLHLNNVTDNDAVKISQLESQYPKTLYTANMAKLMDTWRMFSDIHEQTCCDNDEVISLNSINSDSYDDNDDGVDIHRLFSKSNVTVTLGVKRFKEHDSTEDEAINVVDHSEPVFKNEFIKFDFLNNNRNVINSETVNDLLSWCLKTIRNTMPENITSNTCKDAIIRRVLDFSPDTLFSKFFAFQRLLERLTYFCRVVTRNYIAQKLQNIVLATLNDLQDKIAKLQHNLIVQVDSKRDAAHYSKLLLDKTPPLTFFRLNRWVIDEEIFLTFLVDLTNEFKKFDDIG